MSDETGNKRKAKDKAFYIKSAKQAKRSSGELGPGMKGFLCTSNREKDSVREAYNLLNEHADLLFGTESPAAEEVKEELEIEDALSKDLADLKHQQATPIAERRFQSVQSGIKGCLFIRTTIEDPSCVVDSILDGIEKSKQQATKFLLRMLPIQATCKSTLEDILKTTAPLLEKLDKHKNFSILAKVRNHNLKSMEIIEPVADMVKKKYPDIEVKLDEPDVSIVVEVLRKNCCIGIVQNYNQRAKYNLIEFAQRVSKP